MQEQRYNIYTLIHKALRASLSQNLIELGRVDDTDTDAVTEQLANTESLLHFCLDHLRHENEFIHSVIFKLRQSHRLNTADDHGQHERDIAKLLADIAHIKQLPALRRRSFMLELYRHFALFVGENFEHMQIEETQNAGILWEHLTDAQIHDIHHRIVTSETPEENMRVLLMMLPNITHSERMEVLNGFRPAVPAEVFNGLVFSLKALLDAKEYLKLTQTLSLAEQQEKIA